MKIYRIPKPFIFIIFGASGDLAKIKIFPALYALAEQKRLPKDYYIVGFSRSAKTDAQFRKEFSQSVKAHHDGKVNKKILDTLLKQVHYFTGDYGKKEDYIEFRKHLKTLSGTNKITKIAYFSVPPFVFKDIIKNLGETRDSKNEDLRLVLEKPFGHNTLSARELFHHVGNYFSEDCVYLLDHYLGKSAVQSILNLRHNNRILNRMLKGPQISNIQITASEDQGIESRAGYFDKVGTFKDMIQSHLLQILALTSMSIPITDDGKSIHREKYSILSAIKFIESPRNIVLGQYEGYHKEKNIPQNSKTNTFAALRLFIDRETWYKVPIYVRSGKKLNEKHTYVTIELKKNEFQGRDSDPNRIIFELQPRERIIIKLVNQHGASMDYQDITTSDSIACEGDFCLPEHGLLLLDVIRNRKSNFLSFPEIIAAWRLSDQIENMIEKGKVKIEKYLDSSSGPKSQDKITAIDGFKWYDPH